MRFENAQFIFKQPTQERQTDRQTDSYLPTYLPTRRLVDFVHSTKPLLSYTTL